MYLFADTETTGLKADAEIAQFACLHFDKDRKLVGQFKALIKPDGWVMPAETAAFHGITQEVCEQYGIDVRGVLALFKAWCLQADVLVFHNKKYDVGRLQYTAQRTGAPLAMPRVDCTMEMAKPIVKIPPTEKMVAAGMGNQFKSPNLQEAHAYYFGHGFDGAHDALADVWACSKVYFSILDKKDPNKQEAA